MDLDNESCINTLGACILFGERCVRQLPRFVKELIIAKSTWRRREAYGRHRLRVVASMSDCLFVSREYCDGGLRIKSCCLIPCIIPTSLCEVINKCDEDDIARRIFC